MSLTEEERRDVVKYRLKGDYNDNYNLSEDEVLPRVKETAQFIERIKTLIFQNQISKNK